MDSIPPLTISKKINHSHTLATPPFQSKHMTKKIAPAHKKSTKSFFVSQSVKLTHIARRFIIRMVPQRIKILWTDCSVLQEKVNPLDTKISYKTIQKFTHIDKKKSNSKHATLKNSVSHWMLENTVSILGKVHKSPAIIKSCLISQ